ncbi:MAG: hypothetical protein GX410_05355 [Elusimicrobia bacterium]|nr:hypothetical protein [Elusimicrobiota bacterium]
MNSIFKAALACALLATAACTDRRRSFAGMPAPVPAATQSPSDNCYESKSRMRLKNIEEAARAAKALADLLSETGRKPGKIELGADTESYFRVCYSGEELKPEPYYAPVRFKTQELAEAFAVSLDKGMGKAVHYLMKGEDDDEGQWYARFIMAPGAQAPSKETVLAAAVEAAGRYDFGYTNRDETDRMRIKSENLLIPPAVAAKLFEPFAALLDAQPGVDVPEKELRPEGFTMVYTGPPQVRSTEMEVLHDPEGYIKRARELALDDGVWTSAANVNEHVYFLYFGKPWPERLNRALGETYQVTVLR